MQNQVGKETKIAEIADDYVHKRPRLHRSSRSSAENETCSHRKYGVYGSRSSGSEWMVKDCGRKTFRQPPTANGSLTLTTAVPKQNMVDGIREWWECDLC